MKQRSGEPEHHKQKLSGGLNIEYKQHEHNPEMQPRQRNPCRKYFLLPYQHPAQVEVYFFSSTVIILNRLLRLEIFFIVHVVFFTFLHAIHFCTNEKSRRRKGFYA